jgi:hypothetical protein
VIILSVGSVSELMGWTYCLSVISLSVEQVCELRGMIILSVGDRFVC